MDISSYNISAEYYIDEDGNISLSKIYKMPEKQLIIDFNNTQKSYEQIEGITGINLKALIREIENLGTENKMFEKEYELAYGPVEY